MSRTKGKKQSIRGGRVGGYSARTTRYTGTYHRRRWEGEQDDVFETAEALLFSFVGVTPVLFDSDASSNGQREEEKTL